MMNVMHKFVQKETHLVLHSNPKFVHLGEVEENEINTVINSPSVSGSKESLTTF